MQQTIFDEIFSRKKCDAQKLSAFGFEQDGGAWKWRGDIKGGEFELCITVSADGKVDTSLTERTTGEPYILYKTSASGAFVGEIREEICAVLREVAERCFNPSVFRTAQAEKAIDFVREIYGDELEFLWKKFPDNAVWRRKDNNKWYGAILTVAGNKIGLETADIVEIIDLRMKADRAEEILSQKHYLPGWHMNKKSWFTLVLDGGVSDGELFARIRESYDLAVK